MENKAQQLLESLTPGGSEFYNDPEYCVKHIREYQQNQHELIVKLVIEKKALMASKNELLRSCIELLSEFGIEADAEPEGYSHIVQDALRSIKKATA